MKETEVPSQGLSLGGTTDTPPRVSIYNKPQEGLENSLWLLFAGDSIQLSMSQSHCVQIIGS